MNLKTAFSFLLLFIVNHSCKQVYDVDVTQDTSEASPFHVFFIDRSLNDNLGVIVTDTNKREINLFYGDKNSKGSLVNVRQIVTYLPEQKLLFSFELNENLLPQKITSIKNDTTITVQLKNYNLKTNTVDVEIYDTQNTLIQSRTDVSCGEALLKFKEVKRQFDIEKGLRVAAGEGSNNDDCNTTLGKISYYADGLQCLLGSVGTGLSLFAAPVTGGLSLFLTGVGAVFTAANCSSFHETRMKLNNGECIELGPLNGIQQLDVSTTCSGILYDFAKGKKTQVIVGTVLCLTGMLDATAKLLKEKFNPPGLPNDPTFPTSNVFGKSFGDPNIVTFDGKSYEFNGVGEFVATKSSTDNFEIQVRQEELKSRTSSGSVSWNTGLAINTGNDKLCFYPTKYFINQTPYTYSSSIDNVLQSGGSITGDSKTFVVSTGNGDVVKVFNRGDALDYSIIPGTQRQGKMIGIFGNYDKQTDNDLQVRNGTLINGAYGSLYPNFTNSWRIAQNQSLFVYDVGKNTDSYTNRSFPRAPLVISASQRASAERVCRDAGVKAPFLEGCINDVVATGDAGIAQRAKDLQEESIVKTFDIKFGPNDDKSLLKQAFSSNQYGTEYLLCNSVTYPAINRPISVVNGFETTIYLASESPNIIPSELSFNLGRYEWHWSVKALNSVGRYRFYDPLLYLFMGIDSNIAIFDGKLHKVVIQSAINLGAKTSTYRVYFDDILVSENVNFTIRRYRPQDELLVNHQNVSLTVNNTVKLYRWSFKSY
ncbi:VWD domain-containing protein [Spirosoma montaniterrae]|uniref:VWFD domain-containing protein n=1 Tax=Spirosoma montaniterrae TaxID=1178516 RepID=A0A1P9WT94_9BACT|nr:VWD domain-containing protein [Spirosoma montaniterrae]AQG78553.1 hypothetical protein AWR27_03870 [Spirosoma montaniterrae]